MNKVKKIFLLLLILAVLVVFFMGEILPYVGGEGSSPLEQAAAAKEENSEEPEEETVLPVYVVHYMLDGREYYSEKVKQGSCPKEELTPADGNFLGWQDESGAYTAVASTPVFSEMTYTAVVGPNLKTQPSAWFPAAENGLFYPGRSLTRAELAQLIFGLLDEAPVSKLTLPDVSAEDPSAMAAAVAAEQGYIPLKDGKFCPLDQVSPEEFTETLSCLFNGDDVREQLSTVGSSLTRGDAVLAVCSLLGTDSLPEGESGAYYPDVPENLACHNAAALVGVPSEIWGSAEEKHEAGFVLIDGYLYCFDNSGYFVSNAYMDTLSFAPDGRLTSGDSELDACVAEEILKLQAENPSADRNALLAKAYEFVRNSGKYVDSGRFEVGETGWEKAEALNLFREGTGNSYAYAAQFWALARGLGFDAHCFSGKIRNTEDHGWVEIEMDGAPYIFDPAWEGVYLRGKGDYATSMYRLSYDAAAQWNYIRTAEELSEG